MMKIPFRPVCCCFFFFFSYSGWSENYFSYVIRVVHSKTVKAVFFFSSVGGGHVGSRTPWRNAFEGRCSCCFTIPVTTAAVSEVITTRYANRSGPSETDTDIRGPNTWHTESWSPTVLCIIICVCVCMHNDIVRVRRRRWINTRGAAAATALIVCKCINNY